MTAFAITPIRVVPREQYGPARDYLGAVRAERGDFSMDCLYRIGNVIFRFVPDRDDIGVLQFRPIPIHPGLFAVTFFTYGGGRRERGNCSFDRISSFGIEKAVVRRMQSSFVEA
jgi:hypothetical protein